MKDAVLFARTVFGRRTDLWISTFTGLDPDTDRMGSFTKYADAFPHSGGTHSRMIHVFSESVYSMPPEECREGGK